MAYIQKRRLQDGSDSYRVQVRLKGFPTQSASFTRLTDAKKWVQSTEAAIRESRYFKNSEAKKHTISELVDRYIKQVLPSKPKSIRQQTRQLNWWKSKLGAFTLADVTPALLAETRDLLREERGVGPATAVRYMAALSHAFTIATKEWGWLESNPMLKVTKPKEPRGIVRFLDEDEKTALLATCKNSTNKALYPIVVLAISTGMRRGEILNLSWKDIDLDRGRILLEETKNNERRGVPLVGHAHKILIEYSKIRQLNTQLIFPSNHNPNKPIEIRAPFEAALKEAGIENFRFHDLRHTAASYLAMNGASLAEIAEILGHKTLQMVQRYAHLSETHSAGVVASMNEKIFAS